MKKRRLKGFLMQSFLIGSFVWLLSYFLGFTRTGFESNVILDQYQIYLAGAVFFVFLAGIWFFEHIEKKGDIKYGNSIAFSSEGEDFALKFFKRFTKPQLFLLSLIIFGAIGFLSFLIFPEQIQFTGVGYLEKQQFTAFDSLLFSTSLIAGSENLGLALVIALSIFGLRFFARRYNWSKDTFIALLFLIIILGISYGISVHQLVYSDQEIKLIKVGGFWGVGTTITLLTGSFIPFWVLHMVNNLIIDLARYLDNDMVLIYVFIGLIVLIFTYSLIYKNKLLGEKRE